VPANVFSHLSQKRNADPRFPSVDQLIIRASFTCRDVSLSSLARFPVRASRQREHAAADRRAGTIEVVTHDDV
jgi:hypothetical protein